MVEEGIMNEAKKKSKKRAAANKEEKTSLLLQFSPDLVTRLLLGLETRTV